MTNEDLKTERARLGYTQKQMAKFLADTPLSTYVKWEQGINDVPAWVNSVLVPKKMQIPGLSLEEIIELDTVARAKGLTLEQLIGDFIRKGLKASLAIALLLGAALYAVRSERPDPATLSAAEIAVPAARKQQPGTDDE